MADDEHPEHHHGERGDRGWSIGEYVANWRTYEGSFAKKCALATRNLTLGRLRHGTCCGHYGEPGC